MVDTKLRLNVYRDPWIDANFIDGHIERVSIRECLVRAKEIRSLFIADAKYYLDHTVPYTMLTLFLARVFKPNHDDKLDMLKAGSFDVAMVDEYIEACEKNGISFDVFDEYRPFMQDADYQVWQGAKPESKSVGILDPYMVAGNNTVFYHNRDFNTNGEPVESILRMTPPQFLASVARNYMYHNGTGQSCGTGYSPNQPPLHCIIHGRNLFETLILSIPRNLCGVPLWERRYDMTVPEIINEYGHLDYISAAFLPTVSIRFGDIEDGAVKNVWYCGNIYKENKKLKKKANKEEAPGAFRDSFRIRSETGMNNMLLMRRANQKNAEEETPEFYPATLTSTADLTATRLQIMQSLDKTGDPEFIEAARKESLLGDDFQFVIYGGVLSTTQDEPYSAIFDIPISATILNLEVNVQIKKIVRYVIVAANKLQAYLRDMERETQGGKQLKESGAILTIVRHFAEYACEQLVPNKRLHETWIEQIAKEPTDEMVKKIYEEVHFRAMEAYDSYRAYDIRIFEKSAAYLDRTLKKEMEGSDLDAE